MSTTERRRHPRISIRLPITHQPAGADGDCSRDFTSDISPGGVRFVTAGDAPEVGRRLTIELSIPPGMGHFPYAGKIHGLATVLRCEAAARSPLPCWSVAAQFGRPLHLEF